MYLRAYAPRISVRTQRIRESVDFKMSAFPRKYRLCDLRVPPLCLEGATNSIDRPSFFLNNQGNKHSLPSNDFRDCVMVFDNPTRLAVISDHLCLSLFLLCCVTRHILGLGIKINDRSR